MARKLKPQCFELLNFDGKPVLYRTDDLAVNKFTFRIINLTDHVLRFTGGAPVKLIRGGTAATAGGTTFAFDFESMLTESVVRNMKITLPANWEAKFFPGSGSATPPSWSIAPLKDVALAVNEFIKIEIAHIQCAASSPGNFEIMYSGIQDYADAVFPVLKHLNVFTPPDPKKKSLDLVWSYTDPIHPTGNQLSDKGNENKEAGKVFTSHQAIPVYITYDARALIKNGFTFILSNNSKDPIIPAATLSDADAGAEERVEPPVLYISFLFGDQDYAITTQQLADSSIKINVKGKLDWTPSMHTDGTSYWKFFPQDPKIMNGLETVHFPVTNIITALGAVADTISIMYVQFNNVPGYNDTAFSLQMQKKKAKAAMLSFRTNKNLITLGENVLLSWSSFLARRVTLEYENRSGRTVLIDSDSGAIKTNETNFALPERPSAENTVIYAKAYDESPSDPLDVTIKVRQVQAEISRFTAAPQLFNSTTATDVTFSWETINAKQVMITGPDGAEHDVTNSTSIVFSVDKAREFTLFAYSYGDVLKLPTKETLRTFTYRPGKSIAIPLLANQQQKLPTMLVNNAYGRLYVVNAGNNTIYNINIATCEVEKTYPGDVVTLSADGKKLFIANRLTAAGRTGVIMHDVPTGKQSQAFNIQSQSRVLEMIVSPDVKKLFFAITLGAQAVIDEADEALPDQGAGFDTDSDIDTETGAVTLGGYFTINAEQNTLALGSLSTSVSPSVNTLAFNRDCSLVYFGAYDRSYIALSKYSDGVPPSRNSIDIGRKNGFLFKTKHSANKLYLACAGENVVVVIDTIANSWSKNIMVYNHPANMLMSADEKRLYVSCFEDNKVAVINTETDEVISTFTGIGTPTGLAMNAAGDELFAGNYCAKTLTLIDIAKGKVVNPALPTGSDKGNPFAVATYPDGENGCKVFVAKESYPARAGCASPVANTSLEVTVFAIQKPARSKKDTEE